MIVLEKLARSLKPTPATAAWLGKSALEELRPILRIHFQIIIDCFPIPDVINDSWELLPMLEGKADQGWGTMLLEPLDKFLCRYKVVCGIPKAVADNDEIEVYFAWSRLGLALSVRNLDFIFSTSI